MVICEEHWLKAKDWITAEVPDHLHELMRSCCRGDYQRMLVCGGQRWSGSDLAGKASDYGASYARSRNSLAHRIAQALPAGWTIGTPLCLVDSRWQRLLVLYSPAIVAHVVRY